MPRQARSDAHGTLHHVIIRGTVGQSVVLRRLLIFDRRLLQEFSVCERDLFRSQDCHGSEWVNTIESTSVNRADEQANDVDSVFGCKEEGMFPIKDGPLGGLFAEVVVEGRSRYSRKQSQWLPTLDDIGDSLSHGGIGFYPSFTQLFLQPLVEPFDDRTAAILMKPEALV